MTTFIDSNILIAILKKSETIHEWAIRELEACKREGPAVISDVVYSEVSVTLDDVEQVNAFISALGLERYPNNNDDAMFLAGRAHLQYRKNKGDRTGTLPDFFIGAIAEVEDAPLMTNDVRRYKTYFPKVRLITPP
jgi:predicted nucleic acid-binding protein